MERHQLVAQRHRRPRSAAEPTVDRLEHLPVGS